MDSLDSAASARDPAGSCPALALCHRRLSEIALLVQSSYDQLVDGVACESQDLRLSEIALLVHDFAAVHSYAGWLTLAAAYRV